MYTLWRPDTVRIMPLALIAYPVPLGPQLLHLFQFQFWTPLPKNKELTSLPLLVKGASKGSGIITDASMSFCSEVNFQSKAEEIQDLPGEEFSTPYPPPIPQSVQQLTSWPQPVEPSPPPVSSIPPNVSSRPQQLVSPSPEPVEGPVLHLGLPDKLQDWKQCP